MVTLLLTLLRAFYWVAVPIYFTIYALAMRADSHAAFWFDGGSTEFGPAAFYVLILCWIVPVALGMALSVAGHKEILSKVMLSSLALSLPIIPGLLFSSQGQSPMIVPHFRDYFSNQNFWYYMISLLGWLYGVVGTIYLIWEDLFGALRKIEISSCMSETLRTYKIDNEQLWLEHQELSRNPDKLKMLLNEFASGAYSSSSEFFALLTIVRRGSFGMDLAKVTSDTISQLKNATIEYKLGRFTSTEEYESFKKKRHSDSLGYDADEKARSITHPFLIKMYNAGGALRARALEISENTSGVKASTAVSVPPIPATIQNTNLLISRNGQIIMQDVQKGNVPTLVMQGSLCLTDYYWCTGMSTWLPLATLTTSDAPMSAKTAERSLASALVSLVISWLITVVIGVLILGIVGYGNSGADGAGRLIGAYIGLLIFVRPLFLVIEIISRAITGKRGVDLLAP